MLDYPLVEELDKIADKFITQERTAPPAATDYQALAWVKIPVAIGRYASARYSLMKLSPHTGRKHQLRCHMAPLRHPIIGDTTYRDLRQNRGVAVRRRSADAARQQLGADTPYHRRTADDPHRTGCGVAAASAAIRLADGDRRRT